MKFFILLFLTTVIYAQEAKDDKNPTDLEKDEIVKKYTDCLLDKGPCTEGIREIKNLLPSVLETNCEKCSDEQKEFGRTGINLLKTSYPKIWSDFQAHYDPEGKNLERLEKFLNA